MTNDEKRRANSRLVWRMVLVAGVMFAFGFIVAPFYDAFCELTGIGGRVKNEASTDATLAVGDHREITLEFVTSLNENMPLAFRAEKSKLTVHPGQFYTVKFYAESQTDKRLLGRAIPSVAPAWISQHLKKTECFCFSEQVFEPHQARELPVRFTIDPAIPAEVNEMTLSYTFFDITAKQQN